MSLRRSGTSPTGTDTTGRLQASASFTVLGEPSWSDVNTSASHAFIKNGTSVCGAPQATRSSAGSDRLRISTASRAIAYRFRGSAGFPTKSTNRLSGDRPR